MRSARSRNVPNENNWDAESNRKHHHRDDDFENDEKDDENKKYLFGDGKKHRYVRYMLNVPMKLGRMKLILLTLVGFLVLFSVFSGRSESRISTTLGASGNHRRSNHHRANNNNKVEEDDDEEEEDENENENEKTGVEVNDDNDDKRQGKRRGRGGRNNMNKNGGAKGRGSKKEGGRGRWGKKGMGKGARGGNKRIRGGKKTGQLLKMCAMSVEGDFITYNKTKCDVGKAMACDKVKPVHVGECGNCTKENVCPFFDKVQAFKENFAKKFQQKLGGKKLGDKMRKIMAEAEKEEKKIKQICTVDGSQFENMCQFAIARCEAAVEDKELPEKAKCETE